MIEYSEILQEASERGFEDPKAYLIGVLESYLTKIQIQEAYDFTLNQIKKNYLVHSKSIPEVINGKSR